MNKLQKVGSLGQILKLLGTIHLLSPSLVRLVNPETYTSYCVYSEEEVNNRDYYLLEDNANQLKHIKVCSSLDCEYYEKLVGLFFSQRNNNKLIGHVSLVLLPLSVLFLAASGLSLIVGITLSFGSLGAGGFFSYRHIQKSIKEMEEELKLKQKK